MLVNRAYFVITDVFSGLESSANTVRWSIQIEMIERITQELSKRHNPQIVERDRNSNGKSFSRTCREPGFGMRDYEHLKLFSVNLCTDHMQVVIIIINTTMITIYINILTTSNICYIIQILFPDNDIQKTQKLIKCTEMRRKNIG